MMSKTTEMVGVPKLRAKTEKSYGLINEQTGEPRGLTGLIGRDFLQHCRIDYDGTKGTVAITVDRQLFDT